MRHPRFLTRFITGILLPAAALLLLTTSCGKENQNVAVDRIRVQEGENQCSLPGEPFQKYLRIEAFGKPAKNFFGKETSRPSSGAEVRFASASGSDLVVKPSIVKTDSTGSAYVSVTAGKKIGDNYLEIIPADAPDKKVRVRYIVGMKVTGSHQEGRTGQNLAEPLTVELRDSENKPAANVPVYFTISGPEKKSSGKIRTENAVTGPDGKISTGIQLGKKSGVYSVGIEVADPRKNYFIREIRQPVFALDAVTLVITVIGGLTFFVFGMKMMGDGLMKVAGENMKRILQFFSKTSLVAILAGTVVTAFTQSSSATTVMVVGFINAGLLSLQQSIGIIFGANIGTTVTAQIISFNLTALALPAIALGFFATLLSKRRVVAGWGESVFGFGLLFYGMNLMSTELKMLADFESFRNFFLAFDCAPLASNGGFMPIGAVVGAILIGVVATFVIQSSSAALGIVLALAGGGLINFYTAVPILLGTNIGTTITMFLASLAANRVAKQAALAHFLFNVFGTVVMVALFYVPYGPARIPVFLYFINNITPGNAFAVIPQGVERHIAMAHTLFNVMAVALLYPVLGPFTRLCEKLLPIRDKEEEKTDALDLRLISTPSVALEQVVIQIRKMVKDSWRMIDTATNKHFIDANLDASSFRELKEQEKKIDAMQVALTNYLVKITRHELTQTQSELVPLLMHCINDAERIADHAETIAKLTKRLAKSGAKLSDIARNDLNTLWEHLDYQAKNVTVALGSTDRESVESALASERKINKLAKKYEKHYTRKGDIPTLSTLVEENGSGQIEETELPIKDIALENEREINQLAKQYEEEHVTRRNEGKCSVESSVIFIEMLWELEHIGDHLANIAVRTPEIQQHYVSLNFSRK